MRPRPVSATDVLLLAGVLGVGLLAGALLLGPSPALGERPAAKEAAPTGAFCPVPSRAMENEVQIPSAAIPDGPVPSIDAAAPAETRRATFALG